MIKILELFGGIGACTQAFKRLGIPYEIADYVEIDKYAVKSYNAINGSDFEPQDICQWDKDIAVDFIMHGSPCQDFSIAGKQAGGDEGSGTRSSLLYETLRIVEKTRPKYVLWENVRNLMSAKHKPNWEKYCQRMEELGYRNYAQILNAKNYGIPQNRERVYTMSIRNDIPGDFQFPEPKPLEKKLKDVLEDEVDEKYYLTDAQVASFKASTKKAEAKGNGFKFEPLERERESSPHSSDESREQTDRQLYSGVIGKVDAINGHDILKRVYGTDGVSPTLSTMGGGNTEPKIVASRGRGEHNMQHLEPRKDGLTNTLTSVQKDNMVVLPGAYGRNFGSKGKIENPDGTQSTLQAAMGEGGGNVPLVPIKTATKAGYDLAQDGDGIDLAYPYSATPRGRVGHGVAKTLATSDNQGCLDGMRIRKLTPKECWRLMGFDDADFAKAEKVNSNTQLYKQAGNSIVVDVLEAIIGNLEIKEEK